MRRSRVEGNELAPVEDVGPQLVHVVATSPQALARRVGVEKASELR